MASEQTAAAEGPVGQLRFDPFAKKPFWGYNIASHWTHWVRIGATLSGLDHPTTPRGLDGRGDRRAAGGTSTWLRGRAATRVPPDRPGEASNTFRPTLARPRRKTCSGKLVFADQEGPAELGRVAVGILKARSSVRPGLHARRTSCASRSGETPGSRRRAAGEGPGITRPDAADVRGAGPFLARTAELAQACDDRSDARGWSARPPALARARPPSRAAHQ